MTIAQAKPRFRRRLLQLAILVVVAICAQQIAEAQKTVVIFNFAGPAGAKARRGVIRAMAQQVSFSKLDDYLAEGEKAGVDPSRGKGLVTTCSRAKVDAVIKGKVVRRRRGKYTVVVSVVDGGTGQRLGRRAATVRGARRVARAGLAIGKQLLPMVQEARYAAPKPKKRPKPAPVHRPRTRRPPKKQPEARKGKLDGLLDVSVTLGVALRNFKLAGADATLDRAYEGGAYPEFAVRLELFPIALLTDNFARNVGLGFSYSRHLSISTTMETKQGQAEVDTSSWEMLLDLLVRWPILDRPTTPVVNLHVGWGMRNFVLGPNHILPTFKYNFLRFGLGGYVPLTTRLFAIIADFDLRPVLGMGQDAVNAFGAKESGFGWSIRAGLGGRLDLGLTYGLVFEYLRFSADFAGRYDIPNDKQLESPVQRRDPTSGSDSFIRFWAYVGYAL